MPHFAEILTELDVSLHNLALLQLKSFANFQLVTFSVGIYLICTLITFPTLIYSQRKFHDARLFASLRLFDRLEYFDEFHYYGALRLQKSIVEKGPIQKLF